MNASKIISDDMTLDEKLAAIDAAMASAQPASIDTTNASAPVDPADLTMCLGCQ